MSETGAPRVDMSSTAIDRRLRQVSDLLDLCRDLAKARRIGSTENSRDDQAVRGTTVPAPDPVE